MSMPRMFALAAIMSMTFASTSFGFQCYVFMPANWQYMSNQETGYSIRVYQQQPPYSFFKSHIRSPDWVDVECQDVDTSNRQWALIRRKSWMPGNYHYAIIRAETVQNCNLPPGFWQVPRCHPGVVRTGYLQQYNKEKYKLPLP
jgi:hypothetical protein